MSDDDTELRDEAAPDDTVLPSAEPSDAAEEDFHPFDELREDYGTPIAGTYVTGLDGMPAEVDKTSPTDIPALSTETLICMADASRYVARNGWGEVVVWFTPLEVTKTAGGVCRVPLEFAMQRLNEQKPGAWASHETEQRAMNRLLSDGEHQQDPQQRPTSPKLILSEFFTGHFLLVEPVRPACRHYVRQETQFDMNPQHSVFTRLCSARRTTEGTFMTVRDMGLWACNMRSPRDFQSEARMAAFDRRKIAEGKSRQSLPMFTGIFEPPGGDQNG